MNNKNGILVITDIFSPIRGGTAVWFDEVYSRLGGKEIHVVTGETPGSEVVDNAHPNAVHRVLLKHSKWVRPYSLPIYLNLARACFGVVFRNRVGTVHAGKALPEGLVGWFIARLFRLPLVIYAHGEEITTWRKSRRLYPMRFTYQHADKIIANSEFTRGELIKLGVDAARIEIISPGVNLERYRPENAKSGLRESLGMQPKQKLILSVGRLNLRKGFDQVIRVLPDLAGRGIDAHYAIIGTGEGLEYLKSLAEETGVRERVHFLGAVRDEDLPGWYYACDVFAMPNREINGDTEGFGMVFLEAAACGKPSIAGEAGGTGAAVLHEVTGLRVDGASPEQVEQALEKLLSDDSMRATLGQAGLKRAREFFDWDVVAQKTASIVAALGRSPG